MDDDQKELLKLVLNAAEGRADYLHDRYGDDVAQTVQKITEGVEMLRTFFAEELGNETA